MTDLMNAGCGSAEGVVLARIPVPAPGPEDLLVKVAAAGLNRADLGAARGFYGPAAGATPRPIGMEWAGEVVAVGSAVTGFATGDWVACSGAGGYADYALADQGRAIRFDPAVLPVDQAAVLPLALMTAHNALITIGRMRQGDTVLVHGASSGVGLATLRIARLMGAGLVIGTSTTEWRRNRLTESGADVAIDATAADWPATLPTLTGGKAADVIVDFVTGPAVSETMKAAAVLGRIVNVGRLGGGKASFDLELHALNRLSFTGVTFRTRSLAEIRDIVAKVRQDLWSLVESGALSLPIDRAFQLAEAPQALAFMAGNKHFGKLLLRP